MRLSASTIVIAIVASSVAILDAFQAPLLRSPSVASTSTTRTSLLPNSSFQFSSVSPISPCHHQKQKLSIRQLAAKDDNIVGGTGTASIPNEIFNLVKSIVGASVLSLPVGKLFCSAGRLEKCLDDS